MAVSKRGTTLLVLISMKSHVWPTSDTYLASIRCDHKRLFRLLNSPLVCICDCVNTALCVSVVVIATQRWKI